MAITIPQNDRFNTYVAAGGQTIYAYDYPIYETSDLAVYVNAALLTLTTDYTVSGAGLQAGGNVTLVVASTLNDSVVIAGDLPELRSTNYSQAGDFTAVSINTGLNKQIQLDQQLRRDVDRSIHLALSDPTDVTTVSMEVPNVAARADKYVSFDALGAVEMADAVGVSGPASSVENEAALFTGTDGQTIKRPGTEFMIVPQGTDAQRGAPASIALRGNNQGGDDVEAYINAAWTSLLSSGTGAPIAAAYITATAEGVLTNEQSIGALTTGIMKNTVAATVGTISTAVEGTDYYAPGGTDVAVVDGGTGASDAATARTNLGLGTISTQDANAVAITGGTISGITQLDVDNIRIDGNTISSTDANGDIALAPNGTGNVTTSAPVVFTAQAAPAHAAGMLFYDEVNECPSFFNDEADITLQVGQENWVRVYNNSGGVISNGEVVYVSGKEDTEDRLTIALAQADTAVTSKVLGLATHDIEDNSFGFVVQFGYSGGLDTSAFTDGDSIWLSDSVAGALTATEPASPNFSVFLGYIVDSDAATGNLFITTIANTSGVGSASGDATQLVVLARKGSAGTINVGDACYISGYNNGQGVAEVEFADSSVAGTMPGLGICESTITNASNGFVVVSGRVANFDTSAFTAGDEIYVSETGTTGNTLTGTKPTGVALIQKVGIIMRSHATLGVMDVIGAGRSNDIPNFTAADKYWYGGATGTAAEGDITAFGRSLIDDASAAAGATTLGLGTTDNVSFLNGDFTGTEALKIPEGTTAQRPGVPAEGDFRINTTLGTTEIYRGAAWVDLESGGATGSLVFLTSSSPAAAASVEFVDVFSGTYDQYMIVTEKLRPAADITDLRMTLSDDSGVTYKSTGYSFGGEAITSAAGEGTFNGSGAAYISLNKTTAGYGIGGTLVSEGGVSTIINIFNPFDSTRPTVTSSHQVHANGSSVFMQNVGFGHAPAFEYDSLKLAFNSSTMTGIVRVYGITNS